MRMLTVLLVAVALAAAGCGGSSAGPATGNETTATTAQVPFDRAFIDAMVPHHTSGDRDGPRGKAGRPHSAGVDYDRQ
jgi:uncharacterized protein (DUF305 family)